MKLSLIVIALIFFTFPEVSNAQGQRMQIKGEMTLEASSEDETNESTAGGSASAQEGTGRLVWDCTPIQGGTLLYCQGSSATTKFPAGAKATSLYLEGLSPGDYIDNLTLHQGSKAWPLVGPLSGSPYGRTSQYPYKFGDDGPEINDHTWSLSGDAVGSSSIQISVGVTWKVPAKKCRATLSNVSASVNGTTLTLLWKSSEPVTTWAMTQEYIGGMHPGPHFETSTTSNRADFPGLNYTSTYWWTLCPFCNNITESGPCKSGEIVIQWPAWLPVVLSMY